MERPIFFYKCDPALNKECLKTHCQMQCQFTTEKKYSKDGKKYVSVNCEFIECKD